MFLLLQLATYKFNWGRSLWCSLFIQQMKWIFLTFCDIQLFSLSPVMFHGYYWTLHVRCDIQNASPIILNSTSENSTGKFFFSFTKLSRFVFVSEWATRPMVVRTDSNIIRILMLKHYWTVWLWSWCIRYCSHKSKMVDKSFAA